MSGLLRWTGDWNGISTEPDRRGRQRSRICRRDHGSRDDGLSLAGTVLLTRGSSGQEVESFEYSV